MGKQDVLFRIIFKTIIIMGKGKDNEII